VRRNSASAAQSAHRLRSKPPGQRARSTDHFQEDRTIDTQDRQIHFATRSSSTTPLVLNVGQHAHYALNQDGLQDRSGSPARRSAGSSSALSSSQSHQWLCFRRSGNYWLINVKLLSDCFVPRLVTQNAVAACDRGSRIALTSCCLPNDLLRDADEFTPQRVPEDSSRKTPQASGDPSHPRSRHDTEFQPPCRLLDTVRFHPRAKGRSQYSLYGAWL
jgi:hypothetical protein